MNTSISDMDEIRPLEPGPSSRKFVDMMGIQYPIIQAGMAGPATAPLVSAVANAGAVGTLPLTFLTPDEAALRIKSVQAQTDNPFLVNFILNFPAAALDTAIEAGVRGVLFSWGLPDSYSVDKLRRNSIKMGIQVSDRGNAELALALAPDFLIVQGIEAGGHVQGNQPLSSALQEVLEVADGVPVAVAGGIANGEAVRRYLDAGAAAAVLGSRFVATQESAAHPDYKRELVAASSAAQTVLTVVLNKLWPNATHRLLRSNTTFQMWEAAGRPTGPHTVPGGSVPITRPGEYDIVAITANGAPLERYVDVVPAASMRHVDVNALGTYAGEGVEYITDIPTAGEVVERLVIEAGLQAS